MPLRKSLLATAVAAALALTSSGIRAQQTIAGSAVPSGGRVVAGKANISQVGTMLAIQQSTARAAIDWQSFNIGASASVVFNQPSASAVALNRVRGGSFAALWPPLGQLERLSENVKVDIPQTPQYGAGLASGHQRGGDYLFEVRRHD